MSLTGFEHAVAAPSASAKSSTRFQFSAPFNPLPAEITSSASVNATFPVSFCVLTIFVLASFSETLTSNCNTSAV